MTLSCRSRQTFYSLPPPNPWAHTELSPDTIIRTSTRSSPVPVWWNVFSDSETVPHCILPSLTQVILIWIKFNVKSIRYTRYTLQFPYSAESARVHDISLSSKGVNIFWDMSNSGMKWILAMKVMVTSIHNENLSSCITVCCIKINFPVLWSSKSNTEKCIFSAYFAQTLCY